MKFLNYLYNQGLALPDRAQVNFKDYYISADFVYDNSQNGIQTFVFIDGSVHDKASVREDDDNKSELPILTIQRLRDQLDAESIDLVCIGDASLQEYRGEFEALVRILRDIVVPVKKK